MSEKKLYTHILLLGGKHIAGKVSYRKRIVYGKHQKKKINKFKFKLKKELFNKDLL